MSEKISTLLSSGLVLHETPQLKPLSDELDETGKTQGEIRDTVYLIFFFLHLTVVLFNCLASPSHTFNVFIFPF